jgi:glycosyltransferase involved in cell wall biosynthesis
MTHELPRFVIGASARNDHVQQMARALHDVNRLACYVTGAVDVWHSPWMRGMRSGLAHVPRINRQLSRRAITEVPAELVQTSWSWDLARTVAGAVGAGRLTQDWLWEKGELALDGRTARLLNDASVGAYLGVEFGALASLQAAAALGKPGWLAFLSPHHRTRARWLEPEWQRFGDRRTDADRRLDALGVERDRRRDDEAHIADGIVSGSSFTTRSLVAAGISEHRILTVPLGGPVPVDVAELPVTAPTVLRFIYAGPVAVHKGVHHLLEAWGRLAPAGAELHIYGQQRLPAEVVARARGGRAASSIVFHGSVPAADLREVYRQGSALILPTLADGFGQVVADALAHGLPVITTVNAGASDRVVHGECGFVLPPADVDVLTSTIDWCLTHPAELFAMRPAALAQARRWTWAHFRSALVDGLTDMAAGRGPRIARSA